MEVLIKMSFQHLISDWVHSVVMSRHKNHYYTISTYGHTTAKTSEFVARDRAYDEALNHFNKIRFKLQNNPHMKLLGCYTGAGGEVMLTDEEMAGLLGAQSFCTDVKEQQFEEVRLIRV